MYRVDLVIGTDGYEETTAQLQAMDKFLGDLQKRADAMKKLTISPAVRLNDRITEPARTATAAVTRLDKARASPAARLNDQVTSKARAAGSMLRSLTRRTWSVTIAAKDLVTGSISRVKNALFSLPAALGLAGGVAGGIVAPTKLSGEMEQANIAFTTMLGSASKAKALLSDLQDFANKTPFVFPQLRDSSKRLLAFGFTAKQILPTMKAIGNASSGLGLGSEGIDRITLALGQMKAKAKVSGDEMLQLTEAGIPAWDILAKRMGITTAQAMKLSERGLIPANQAIDALLDGMNQRFPNMMDQQSKSLFGLLSTIKDTFSSKILMRWGDGIRDGIQPRLAKLADWIDHNEATINRWGNNLERSAGYAADWVARKFENLVDLFNDPVFQNADMFGKIRIAWDKIISDPFEAWWDSGGQQKVDSVAAKMGNAIGGTLGGLIMGALGVAAGDSGANDSPFIQAGRTAGTAFLNSFLDAFDAGKIASKAMEAFKDVNVKAIKDPSPKNIATAGIASIGLGVIAGWGVKRILQPVKAVKGLFSKGATKVASNTATESVVKTTGSTTLESRGLIKANPKSPYSPGWNPRYATPPKPEVPLTKTWLPGVTTAGKIARSLIGYETIPMLAGSIISNELIKHDLERKAVFKQQFANDQTILNWGKLPEWQRFGVNTGTPITRKEVTAIPAPSKTLTQEEVDSVANFLAGNIKPETKNEITVNVPSGAVQITMPTTEPDYDEISNKVGVNFAGIIKKAFENK